MSDLTEEELRATREMKAINKIVTGNKVYTEKEVKEKYVSKKRLEEYIKNQLWLCEHDLEACCDDEIECIKYFKTRKEIFEEIQIKFDELLESE